VPCASLGFRFGKYLVLRINAGKPDAAYFSALVTAAEKYAASG